MSCKVEELQSDITKGKVNDTTQCLNNQEEEWFKYEGCRGATKC